MQQICRRKPMPKCNFNKVTLEVFLRKGVRKMCSEFTREHACRSAISVKLQSNFIEIAIWHGWCSLVCLLHIFRKPFPKNNFGGPLLKKSWGLLAAKYLCNKNFIVNVLQFSKYGCGLNRWNISWNKLKSIRNSGNTSWHRGITNFYLS